jgi:hypothetical protein
MQIEQSCIKQDDLKEGKLIKNLVNPNCELMLIHKIIYLP